MRGAFCTHFRRFSVPVTGTFNQKSPWAACLSAAIQVHVSDRLRALSALLYADDQVLIASSPQELQSMMDVVADYAELWQFHLNAKKSAVIVYGGSRRVYPLRVWWLAGNLVEECSSYRYLGVIIQAQVSHGLSRASRTHHQLG